MSTFLIVDDSPQKIMLMQSMLHRHGWKGTTLIASTTEEAEEMIDTQDIEYGFIDYFIPSENGPAIIRYLKEKNPTARIALVSSSNNPGRNAEAKNAGVEVCICTSDEMDTVEKAFRDLLKNWASVPP